MLDGVLEAARELQEFLTDSEGRFCFIGGVAVQRWGEPRFTRDADLSLLTEFVEDEKWVDLLLSRFQPRLPQAREFALNRRVLLVRAANGINIDVALGGLPFEERSIERASPWKLSDGSSILTCSAEDLIVYKAFASRDLDWFDVEGIVIRQAKKLNIQQIFDELTPLADLKEDPGIIKKLEALLMKRGLSQ